MRVGEAIRALYASGLFRDVELRRDGDTLLVVVAERPTIAWFEIRGNKDIKTEDLQKNLRRVGLAYGKTFDRSVLEDVEQFLTDQYFSRGKYGVRVDTHVTELRNNEVGLVIDIKEGKRAKIEQINLVGITRFKEQNVLRDFELKTPNWLSWYKQDDRYSRETLRPATWKGCAPTTCGPRPCRFPGRVDAGGHCARNGRHVHHGERQ